MKKKTVWTKDFILLAFGSLISLLGSNIQQFALALYVYDRTKSPTLFASLLAISAIPRIILAPIAGVCGDWFNRKKSIVFFDLFNGVLIGGVFTFMLFKPEIPLIIIFALVIILEIVEIFFGASMTAVIPSIVEKENLAKANSVKAFNNSLGGFLTPIIGAILFQVFGLRLIFLINAVSFVVSAVSEMFIAIPATHKAPEKINVSAFMKDCNAGVKIIKDSKYLPKIIGLCTLLNFCLGSMFSVGIYYIFRELIVVSKVEFGISQGAIAGIMLIGPILAGIILKKSSLAKVMIRGFILTGILFLIMGGIITSGFIGAMSNYLVPYILIIALTGMIGIVAAVVSISLGTLLQQIVPMEFMGRVGTAFDMFVTMAIPIGQMIFGFLLNWIDISIIATVLGIIVLISTFSYRKPLLTLDEDKKSLEGTEAL